jgi:hypothetical protein
MTDELKKVGKAAIFGEGPTPEEARVFGRMLFTYGWRLSAAAFALWGLGAFERFGLGGGFAYADPTEVVQDSVQKRLSAIERRQEEQDIMTTLKESCAAPTKDYFRTRLNELQKSYDETYKGRLPVPTCEQMGILPNG